MIAQVVFDLPLDGPFDYLIPPTLAEKITVGTRVKVSFGPRTQTGFVVSLLERSAVIKLKSILALCDASAVFNKLDLAFAQGFCAYYGCSLGEALGTILRNKTDPQLTCRRDHQPIFSLYSCQPHHYTIKIQEIMRGYPAGSRFLILVPDAFRVQLISQGLKGVERIEIGMRSLVFKCDGQFECVMMIDEENPSYQQEQMPMYDTAQVLLSRSNMYGFDVAFVGISPSVELMAMTRDHQVKWVEEKKAILAPARVVDLSNYKFIPGLISPPVRDALDAALKAGKRTVLVLNRKGSYRLTRCVDCAGILKCSHCDSPLIYSRSQGKYLCRYCTFTAPGDIVCPTCHKSNWRSQGIGIEQLQTELKKYFPQAKIVSFEGTRHHSQSLPEFDILIATSAVLRFQGMWQCQVTAFIDFDAELNRLNMRSAFNAFSLALHISSMAIEPVLIQTRHPHHYVLQSLSRGKTQDFYDEELKLRREFGFSPFKHWVKVTWRAKLEKSALEAATKAYGQLSKNASEHDVVTPPLANAIAKKRDQFLFNVMVQGDDVKRLVAFIKTTLGQIKRASRVIVTIKIDP